MGPLFGLVLFDIFIKGLNNGTESWIIKSVGDTELGESGSRFNSGTGLQHPEHHQKPGTNQMRF